MTGRTETWLEDEAEKFTVDVFYKIETYHFFEN